jgi:hypothetical protein
MDDYLDFQTTNLIFCLEPKGLQIEKTKMSQDPLVEKKAEEAADKNKKPAYLTPLDEEEVSFNRSILIIRA